MRKLIFIITASVSTLFVACGDSSEKNANREYIKASTRVVSAEKAFNVADYAKALELCSIANGEVEKIVEKYPDTSLALKIVSDGSMRIGPCKYVDLREKIIPRLEAFVQPEMKSIELAWAFTVENKAYVNLAEALIKNHSKFDEKTLGKLLDVTISKIDSADERARLRSLYAASKVKPQLVKSTEISKKSVKTSEKILDVAAFLRDAETSASLVSYDLGAVEKLRDMAKKARLADKDTNAKFAAFLTKAYDNVLKISAQSARETALASMAIAFANFGDDLRAIAVSHKITNEDLFYGVFKAIGENASGGANYKEALTLASRLKNDAERAKFLSALAIGVANQGFFDRARQVAAMVQDLSLRNAAYAGIAKVAFDSGKPQEAAACVSSIDIKSLDCLSIFDEGKTVSPESAAATRLAILASKLVEHNQKLAGALNNLALSALNSNTVNVPQGEVFKLIFDNFVKLGNSEVALNFVLNNFNRLNPLSFKDSVCALAKNSKDAELSKKAYALLFEICKDNGDLIEFAVILSANGVSREDSVKILSPILPKFAK